MRRDRFSQVRALLPLLVRFRGVVCSAPGQYLQKLKNTSLLGEWQKDALTRIGKWKKSISIYSIASTAAVEGGMYANGGLRRFIQAGRRWHAGCPAGKDKVEDARQMH